MLECSALHAKIQPPVSLDQLYDNAVFRDYDDSDVIKRSKRHTYVRVALVCSVWLFAGASISAPRKHRAETISGLVVAYSNFPPACMNGNVYWSMVIRVQQRNDVDTQFIRVNFSIPCSGPPPRWISTKAAVHKFHVIRDESRDTVLTEFVDVAAGESRAGNLKRERSEPRTGKISLWQPSSGNESITLPFGQVLPSYRLADVPLAPLI